MEEKRKFCINRVNKQAYINANEEHDSYDIPQKGFYEIDYQHNGLFSIPYMKKAEVQIPTSAHEIAKYFIDYNELELLFSERNISICKSMNISVKTGYLFHGIQGSGKTTLMNAIAHYFNERFNGMAFIVEGRDDVIFTLKFIEELNKFNDYNGVYTIIMDEFEDIFKAHESYMKQVLDGKNTPNNIVFLSATNYLEKIPTTISDRPSRFKHVHDISRFSEPDIIYSILSYLNETLEGRYQYTEGQLKDIVELCIEKTMDEIKHIFIDMNLKLEVARETVELPEI